MNNKGVSLTNNVLNLIISNKNISFSSLVPLVSEKKLRKNTNTMNQLQVLSRQKATIFKTRQHRKYKVFNQHRSFGKDRQPHQRKLYSKNVT